MSSDKKKEKTEKHGDDETQRGKADKYSSSPPPLFTYLSMALQSDFDIR